MEKKHSKGVEHETITPGAEINKKQTTTTTKQLKNNENSWLFEKTSVTMTDL